MKRFPVQFRWVDDELQARSRLVVDQRGVFHVGEWTPWVKVPRMTFFEAHQADREEVLKRGPVRS
jgi:hypothetical protein